MKIKLITTSTDSQKIAETIAENLVSAHLAACVQIIPNVCSTYIWQNKMEITDELLLQVKTLSENVQQCKTIILKEHNYETPELIVTEADIISDNYREWFIKNSLDK